MGKQQRQRWEVQMYFMGGQWENCWTEGDEEKRLTFASARAAGLALRNHLSECRAAKLGHSARDYRVAAV